MKEDHIQISLYAADNMLGKDPQLDLFGDQEYLDVICGFSGRYGIDISAIEARVMEGILRGFSETNYQGNLSPLTLRELSLPRYQIDNMPAYQSNALIPRLQVKQSQIFEWAGINLKSAGECGRAIEAIQQLGTKSFCWYYDRIVCDENKQPKHDQNGHPLTEVATGEGALFFINKIHDPVSGRLKYYEIFPAPIFLDHVSSYFMLVPKNWRDEVSLIAGKGKSTSYIFLFLIFLMYQHETKRMFKDPDPLTIRVNPDELAKRLRMPKSLQQGRKGRKDEILEQAYKTAKQLGYLNGFERLGYLDVFQLNPSKYTSNQSISNSSRVLDKAIQRWSERS